MKNVIIGGPSRSGKSILARRLSESLKLHAMPVDMAVVSLIAGFPELQLTWSNDEASLNRLAPYLRVLLCKLGLRSGFSYVFEGNHLTPGLIGNLGPEYPILEKAVPLFLGAVSANPNARLRRMREYASSNACYTKSMSDEDLLKLIADLSEESRRVKQRCEELGLAYFDTADDFDAALDAAKKYAESRA
ncbi:MAG TPA: hypothetical protein VEJ63_16935 [Planctomycetota bacterium]|nr:hypothetical protein [Planctomycetota bacterium]